MKKNKQIIAFMGDNNSGKTTAANFLAKHGFYKVDIMDKVNDFAQYLFSKTQLQNNKEEILLNIRKRGCAINREYWINLVLITVPDSANQIVFDEVLPEEIINNKIKTYQIVRPNITRNIIPNVEIINNNGTLNDFYKTLTKLIDRINITKNN